MKTIKDYKPRSYADTPIAFFHYWQDEKIKYQGYIVELKKDRSGCCMLFSFMTGEPTDTIVVTRSFFDDCTFYDSDHEMINAYKKSEAK